MIVREEHIVSGLDEDIRFVDYCIGLFSLLQTRNSVKKAIKKKMLYLNQEVASTASWMKVGDCIQFVDNEHNVPKPFNLPILVEYEDDHIAVVRKPAGLVVSGNQHRTLENALVDQLIISNQPDGLKWARPVHRLDAATSGLVILAKTASSHRILAKCFEDRTIEKKYHAIVVGKFDGQVELNESIENQAALSHLRSIKSIRSLQNGFVSLVELSPKTGRTHQLRIHCATFGHPIVGDVLYGEKGNTLLHKGLFLVATKLSFVHPYNNDMICVEIAPPDKFYSFLEREERRYMKFREE